MNFLKNKTELVNRAIEKYIDFPNLPQKKLFEAMSYSVLAGGKRIRPCLALMCCEMLGGNAEKAMPFAVSLEFIHTYSLIHDDLPAMDNDDFRRGKPTNHKVFGEASAILAGDALLNYAFEIGLSADFEAERKVRILSSIARASGAFGMVGGQILDMEMKEPEISNQYNMIAHKTGALFKTACEIGALAAGKDEDTLKTFGENIGLAFQICDDILDVTSTEEELGKPIGSDERNEKVTFVTLLGLKGAREKLEEVTNKGIEALTPFGEKAEDLRQLAVYLRDRGN